MNSETSLTVEVTARSRVTGKEILLVIRYDRQLWLDDGFPTPEFDWDDEASVVLDDGREVPVSLEALFPLIYTEEKHLGDWARRVIGEEDAAAAEYAAGIGEHLDAQRRDAAWKIYE